LIDISVDERDRVTVALDQSFSRPPQLTPLEALALAAAAQEVAPADPAVMSALAKLDRAAHAHRAPALRQAGAESRGVHACPEGSGESPGAAPRRGGGPP